MTDTREWLWVPWLCGEGFQELVANILLAEILLNRDVVVTIGKPASEVELLSNLRRIR
jgi:hypothetical protein